MKFFGWPILDNQLTDNTESNFFAMESLVVLGEGCQSIGDGVGAGRCSVFKAEAA